MLPEQSKLLTHKKAQKTLFLKTLGKKIDFD